MAGAPKVRRAVSPVVAVLLLILIAISAAVIIYAWVSGLAGTAQESPTELQERISVEAAIINSSAGNVTAYVRNIGEVPIDTYGWTISVYAADGTLVGINATNATLTIDNDSDGVFDPGDVVKVSVVFGAGTFTAGEAYRVVVTTPSGVSDSAIVVAK